MNTLQMRVLTDRQLESRASLGDTPLTPLTLGDTPLTIGSSSFEGMPAPANQLTNGGILDTEEELAEAGSYIRSFSKYDSSYFECSPSQATEPAWDPVELDGNGECSGEVSDLKPGVERR